MHYLEDLEEDCVLAPAAPADWEQVCAPWDNLKRLILMKIPLIVCQLDFGQCVQFSIALWPISQMPNLHPFGHLALHWFKLTRSLAQPLNPTKSCKLLTAVFEVPANGVVGFGTVTKGQPRSEKMK